MSARDRKLELCKEGDGTTITLMDMNDQLKATVTRAGKIFLTEMRSGAQAVEITKDLVGGVPYASIMDLAQHAKSLAEKAETLPPVIPSTPRMLGSSDLLYLRDVCSSTRQGNASEISHTSDGGSVKGDLGQFRKYLSGHSNSR